MWTGVAVFAAGIVGGFMNAVAGGASLVAMPALVFFSSLSTPVANATNNVATTLQSGWTWWGFSRRGYGSPSLLWRLGPPALVGALVGAQIVVEMSDRVFSRVVAGLMLLALVLILAPPPARTQNPSATQAPTWRFHVFTTLVFFALGVYGGFFGGGLGLVMLPALVRLFAIDLVVANGVKSGIGFINNATAFAVFAVNDMIVWLPAAVLTVGMLVGSSLGVRWAIAKGHGWIRAVLVVITVAAAIAFAR